MTGTLLDFLNLVSNPDIQIDTLPTHAQALTSLNQQLEQVISLQAELRQRGDVSELDNMGMLIRISRVDYQGPNSGIIQLH